MQTMLERQTLIRLKYKVPEKVSNVEELLMEIHNRSLVEIETEQKSHFQNDKMGAILASFSILIFTSLLRGNKRTKSIIGIEPCSSADWALYGVFITYSLGMQYFCARYIKHQFHRKLRCGYKFLKGDMHWTNDIIK